VTVVTSAERAFGEGAGVGHPKQENVMTIQADTAVEAKIRALTANEIDAVSGGKASFQDFSFVKYVDKSSPVLFQADAPAPAGK
jgi:type VI protein secretion system component Hcp